MQCLPWGEVKKPDWRPIPISIESGGEIGATALVLKRSIPRLRRSIFYLPRGPILDWSKPEIAAALVKKLRIEARKHRAILIKIDPAVKSIRPSDGSTVGGHPEFEATLQNLGFIPSPDARGGFGGTQPRCVMKLDISPSEDELLANFHPKWRYNIRLAERKEVEVRPGTREDLLIFHNLYAITAQRDGFTGRPLSYFQKLWDALVPHDMAKVFITYNGDKPLSAAICFLLPPQCWYVYGASSNEDRKLMPNHAMQWAMIRWAKSRGCTLYDFRGVADETQTPAAEPKSEESDNHLQGLNRFKAGFGAGVECYAGEYDLVLSPTWYWLWTTARPKLVAALKRRQAAGSGMQEKHP